MRFLLAVFMTLGLLAPAAGARAQDGELKIGMTQFPSTLHPAIDSMLAKSYVLAMARRPFTIFDHDWELACMLCTELPTLENGLAKRQALADGGEGIALTYTIQPEATWGDGTPVTTNDVLFTWKFGRHPQSGVGNAELFNRLLKIDVADAKTFTLHVDRITYEYNAINDFRILPAHLEEAIFDAGPAEYRNRTTYDSDPTNPGLYYGPYRIVEVVKGSHLALEKNPTWYGAPPAFDRIVVRAIQNTAALEANLLSGAVDMVAGELGLSVDQAIAFEKRHGQKYAVSYKAGLIYEHIDLNRDNPILQDERVRRALIHAIDRDAISERLFDGKQPPAHGSVSPLDWVHDPDIPVYAHDPDKAEALLDEAGWSVKKGGIRHNAAGEKLTLEIMTTAGNRIRELVQQVLQSQWRKVGIDMRIRNEPARVFFGQTMTKRKFPALGMYAWLSSPENVPWTTLHSTMIPAEENGWAGQNYPGYVNPEMDEILDKMERELDREKRRALWHRMQAIYVRDLPALPLYWRAEPYILPKWLKGLRATGHQYTTTHWVEEWRRAAE